MNLCKDPESWARVDPEAVVGCSHGHAVYVLKMALLDIAKLAAELETVQAEQLRASSEQSQHQSGTENV
jgi:hypothetical protein